MAHSNLTKPVAKENCLKIEADLKLIMSKRWFGLLMPGFETLITNMLRVGCGCPPSCTASPWPRRPSLGLVLTRRKPSPISLTGYQPSLDLLEVNLTQLFLLLKLIFFWNIKLEACSTSPQPLQQSQLMGTTCGRLSLKVSVLRFCCRWIFIICIIKILLWVDFS